MKKNGHVQFCLFILTGIAAVLAAAILSLFMGSTNISWQTVLQALFSPDLAEHQHLAIIELRLPRTLGDILVGAAFAASGAITQGVTRNPLADSGLLGINAGASFALALCLAAASQINFSLTVFASFLGASMAALIVFGLLKINHRKTDSVRLVLAGSAVSVFLTSICQFISIFANIGQDLTFWTAGGTAGIRMDQLTIAAPVILFGLISALLLSRKISLLSLGDDTARGLGLDVERSTWISLFVVMVLAGSAVSLAGPIAFVGLLVPYFVRFFVGGDYQKVIPGSMIAGALFMVLADVAARVINAPSETPVGLIFAVIGVPVFIWIARKGDMLSD